MKLTDLYCVVLVKKQVFYCNVVCVRVIFNVALRLRTKIARSEGFC